MTNLQDPKTLNIFRDIALGGSTRIMDRENFMIQRGPTSDTLFPMLGCGESWIGAVPLKAEASLDLKELRLRCSHEAFNVFGCDLIDRHGEEFTHRKFRAAGNEAAAKWWQNNKKT